MVVDLVAILTTTTSAAFAEKPRDIGGAYCLSVISPELIFWLGLGLGIESGLGLGFELGLGLGSGLG